jgi:DNA repair protein RecO (recombination protein O)
VSQVRDVGLVLRTYRLGEADRIVVIMTQEHGKVRCVAKGVRKVGSRFGARLEPITYIDLAFWKGRSELGVVNQVEVIDRYTLIRADYDRMTAAMTMLEVVDQVAQDNHPDERLLETLVRALAVLNDASKDPQLVAAAFFLRVLDLDGARPEVEACVSCGQEEDLVAFDFVEGGVLCRSCRQGRPLSRDALALLRRILGGDLGAVLGGAVPEGAVEVRTISVEAMEIHLDRRLRSVRSLGS